MNLFFWLASLLGNPLGLLLSHGDEGADRDADG